MERIKPTPIGGIVSPARLKAVLKSVAPPPPSRKRVGGAREGAGRKQGGKNTPTPVHYVEGSNHRITKDPVKMFSEGVEPAYGGIDIKEMRSQKCYREMMYHCENAYLQNKRNK